MSVDSTLLSLVCNRPGNLVKLQQAGITSEHFVEPYNAVFRYIEKTRSQTGKVPSPDVVHARFKDVELHTARQRDLGVLVADLQHRRKFMDFTDHIDRALSNASQDNLDEVLAELHKNLNNLSIRSGKRAVVDLFSSKVSERILENQRRLRRGEMLGLPTGLDKFDRIIGGLHRQRMVVVMARAGVGKAQPLDAKILTPYGWSTMGNMSVGSEVICPDGKIANVIQVHPQGVKDIYRVIFSDGASTEVTEEHLWLTQSHKERRYGRSSVKTTAEISKTIRIEGKREGWNHYVPLVGRIPARYTGKLPVDPYIVGILLGDGHVRTRGRVMEVLLSSDDIELVEEINTLLNDGAFTPAGLQQYRFTGESTRMKVDDSLRTGLSKLGMGSGHSCEKKVPQIYMDAWPAARLAVLQGLLDTDGSPCAAKAEYCTTSPEMACQVRELVWSLGGTATMSERTTSFTNGKGEKQKGRLSYRILIALPPEMDYFRLERKQNLVTKGQKIGRAVRTIKSVELVRQAEAQCITIDHPDHLYVTDDYVVTHNSWLDLLFVAHAVMSGHKAVLFPLEMSLEETAYRLYTIFSSSLFGQERVLKNLDLTLGRVSTKKVVRLMALLEDKFAGQLYVADVSAMNDAYTVERIRAEVAIHRPDMFWVDYLTLMKAPGVGRDGSEDHMTVKALAEGVKGVAQSQNCVGGASAQVNRESLRVKQFLPRLEHLAFGDSIGHAADQVVSLAKRRDDLYYGVVKNRHGPEIGRTRVAFDVNRGIIRESEDQPEEEGLESDS
jgi:replicative DNA helicase